MLGILFCTISQKRKTIGILFQTSEWAIPRHKNSAKGALFPRNSGNPVEPIFRGILLELNFDGIPNLKICMKKEWIPINVIKLRQIFLYIFFGGLECVGHYFA
jgi:hypothetical protein